MMPDQEAIARKYIEALNRRDWTGALALFAEDAEIWIAGQTMDLTGLQKTLEFVAANFAEGPTLEVFNIFQSGDQVGLEMRARAKTISGNDYRNQIALILTIRGERIHLLSEYVDMVPANTAFS